MCHNGTLYSAFLNISVRSFYSIKKFVMQIKYLLMSSNKSEVVCTIVARYTVVMWVCFQPELQHCSY